VASVEETPFDLRGGERLGEHIKASGGIDHCFVLSNNGRDMKMAADVRDPESGRRMRIFTNCPAIQFYTANYLEDFRTRCGIVNPHEAFCLETQEYPDAVNHDNFPDVILRPGHKYQRRTVHNFSII
jgi:aldose 1-epimerase